MYNIEMCDKTINKYCLWHWLALLKPSPPLGIYGALVKLPTHQSVDIGVHQIPFHRMQPFSAPFDQYVGLDCKHQVNFAHVPRNSKFRRLRGSIAKSSTIISHISAPQPLSLLCLCWCFLESQWSILEVLPSNSTNFLITEPVKGKIPSIIQSLQSPCCDSMTIPEK